MKEAIEIALLARLLDKGNCRAASRTAILITRYQTAGWLVAGTRRDEWCVADASQEVLSARLRSLLPTWKQDFGLLHTLGRDPLDPKDIAALPALRRGRSATGLLNRRNWYAVAGLGPKRRALIAPDATLTRDWTLRLRPNVGLRALLKTGEIELDAMAELWSECVLPERGWRRVLTLVGTSPQILITCENLGVFVDLPLSSGAAAAFAPGTDIEPAVALLTKLPQTRWTHFGDLDPEGIAIARQISRATNRPMTLYIPTFADEYLDLAQKHSVNWSGNPELTHPVISVLTERQAGIFQEVFMTDPRLAEDLSAYCRRLLDLSV